MITQFLIKTSFYENNIRFFRTFRTLNKFYNVKDQIRTTNQLIYIQLISYLLNRLNSSFKIQNNIFSTFFFSSKFEQFLGHF